MKKRLNANGKLTYKDKTNFSSGSGTAFVDYLNKSDVKKIINEILKADGEIDEHRFHAELNNVISFLRHSNFIKLRPGKTDKRKLIENICALSMELEAHLRILLNQYGYDTYRHIPLFIYGQMEPSRFEFLSKLADNLQCLSIVDKLATKNIDNTSGKKTGNNEKNAIPNLIYYLAKIYEEFTQKKARENFQQDSTGDSPYKGQFYDFVCSVFNVLNENHEIYSPASNPFKVDFVNELGGVSYSLGKYVQKVFSLASEF